LLAITREKWSILGNKKSVGHPRHSAKKVVYPRQKPFID
jgi:hypothetical protein